MTYAIDPTVARYQRRATINRRQNVIVNRLLSALDRDDWATVGRCDRALGRLARLMS